MSKNITNIKSVSKKSKTHEVTRTNRGYQVISGSSNKAYFVTLSPIASCNCNWAKYQPQHKPVACSHVQSVIAYEAAQDGYNVTARAQDADTSNLHRKEIELGNGVKFTARRI